ncbi:MAG: hypothetical protein AAF502_25005 [Bacteroidota bacterium]
MPALNTLDAFRLLSYERGGLTICTFAENAEEESNNPDFEEHVAVLRHEYGVNGLIYLTDANRILYFFTTDQQFEQESFLNSFFTRTHPELQSGKVDNLLGNTLLYQGKEAVDYLLRFALNPVHLRFIPNLLGQLLEKSREYNISNDGIELAVNRILLKSRQLCQSGPLADFNKMIEDELVALSRECRVLEISSAIEQVPEKINSVKSKAIQEVFGKEFAELDDKTKALAIRMLDFMEEGCKDIPKGILDDLTKS